MSDPWLEEWNTLSYTERLNWWWAARAAYQSQEDFAAGKVASEGVSCKYGIPGFWPGTRTPYIKPEEATAPEVNNDDKATSVTADKPETETETNTEEATATEEATTTSEETEKPGTVNLIIPPSTSTINVHKGAKKRKGKGRH